MLNLKHKGFFDYHALGIAAVGIFAAEYRAVVGSGESVIAVLLLTLVTGRTVPTTIHHATDTGKITNFKIFDILTDGNDPAHDFVARNGGIQRVFPLIAGGVQIGMADTAKEYIYLDIIGTRLTTQDFVGRQRTAGSLSSIGLSLHHHHVLLSLHTVRLVYRIGNALRGVKLPGVLLS